MEQILDIKKYAKEHHIPIMQDAGIAFICNYIKEHKVKHILEIGSAIGYSAIRFALVRDDVFVTTIEKDKDSFQKACININDMNLNDRITIINEDALVYEDNNKYDLIFIDAAKSQYIKFFERFKNNLTSNGVIISDNLSFHGMVDDISLTHNRNTIQLVKKIKKYIEYLQNNEEFQTLFYRVGDGISISIRKS